MADRERGSNALATRGIAVLVLFCCFVIQLEIVQAKTYFVGGETGWSFGVESWPQGKKFMAGDVLVFQYLGNSHSVAKVNHHGYRSCTVPKGSFVTTTGNDRIKLRKGRNFFICSFPEHCLSGMRIAIYANFTNGTTSHKFP